MRRKDKELTDSKTIEEILKKSHVCRIALYDNEYPYIVPMNYGYSENALYFHSASEGRKIDLIRKNNKACFEIEYFSRIIDHELPCNWTMEYCSLIGTGTIEIITEVTEKKKGLDIIMSGFGRDSDNLYDDRATERIVVLKLAIKEISAKWSGNIDINKKFPQ